MTRAQILRELREAGDRRRAAEQAHMAAVDELAIVVKRARDAGVPMTEIAREGGLSRTRVYTLLDKLLKRRQRGS